MADIVLENKANENKGVANKENEVTSKKRNQ